MRRGGRPAPRRVRAHLGRGVGSLAPRAGRPAASGRGGGGGPVRRDGRSRRLRTLGATSRDSPGGRARGQRFPLRRAAAGHSRPGPRAASLQSPHPQPSPPPYSTALPRRSAHSASGPPAPRSREPLTWQPFAPGKKKHFPERTPQPSPLGPPLPLLAFLGEGGCRLGLKAIDLYVFVPAPEAAPAARAGAAAASGVASLLP
uniref:ethylene-responsive transcription factor ABI4-like n=1 Tax=Arvicanthis niloticus TaxID=61156 RepID=UPI001485F02F|nr:ethylene-responsive transcription factor ABI4-like [Arvicanthis niloticus]